VAGVEAGHEVARAANAGVHQVDGTGDGTRRVPVFRFLLGGRRHDGVYCG
jgi:hypothetical protein